MIKFLQSLALPAIAARYFVAIVLDYFALACTGNFEKGSQSADGLSFGVPVG